MIAACSGVGGCWNTGATGGAGVAGAVKVTPPGWVNKMVGSSLVVLGKGEGANPPGGRGHVFPPGRWPVGG
ncbi:hypothetical protein GCM10017673_14640 [Streptosporangium violaceochromogenes]|nr:hypothetical protein GCM10017673_14640 [Streptosporangium violaceochromogenes]